MHDVRFQYRIYAIRGGDRVPHHENDVADSYIGMVDAAFDELIAFLLTIPSGVLFFCNAGKEPVLLLLHCCTNWACVTITSLMTI